MFIHWFKCIISIYIYICVCWLSICMCVYRFYLRKGGREGGREREGERERASSRARNQPAPMREWSQDRNESCNDWWPNCQRCWQHFPSDPCGLPKDMVAQAIQRIFAALSHLAWDAPLCVVSWEIAMSLGMGRIFEIICHHVSWYVIWHPGCFRHFRRRMDGADERLGRTHARHNSECCESATWCNSGVHALDCWLSYWTEVACRET